jgi:hypothetical protein
MFSFSCPFQRPYYDFTYDCIKKLENCFFISVYCRSLIKTGSNHFAYGFVFADIFASTVAKIGVSGIKET